MFIRSLAFALFFLPMCVLAETESAQAPLSGQILKYETKDGGILVDADIDWASYTKVQLEKATVEFRENWVEDQRRMNNNVVREADVERIKRSISELLERALTKQLSDSETYALSSESGAGVLRFTPRVTKLDVYVPARVQNFVGHVLADSQGKMVVALDISDSVSGKLLASSWQRQEDPEKGYLETVSSASNRTAFRLMMDRWATWLLELLDQVRAGPPELSAPNGSG